jgi:hypothetical protein
LILVALVAALVRVAQRNGAVAADASFLLLRWMCVAPVAILIVLIVAQFVIVAVRVAMDLLRGTRRVREAQSDDTGS